MRSSTKLYSHAFILQLLFAQAEKPKRISGFGGLRMAVRCVTLCCVVAALPLTANAQAAAKTSVRQRQSQPRLEEVTVTARKRGVLENAQNVPISVYGFTSQMLQQANMTDLSDLGQMVPTADLPPTAPIKGFANFTIRGMGTVGTVASADPTVSILIDGMPLGIAAGGILDMYDLQSVQVLAGPQGTLFGRNTTGGAVLLRTERPSGAPGLKLEGEVGSYDKREVAGAIEDGWDQGRVSARLAFKRMQNGDMFHNNAGPNIGDRDFYMVRPTLHWEPTDNLTINFVAEKGEDKGDGPAAQGLYDPRSRTTQMGAGHLSDHELSLNNKNTDEQHWGHAIAEINWQVFGGTLTSISAYRAFDQTDWVDADGSQFSVFNFNPIIDQEQASEELRWSGQIADRVHLTSGLFLFRQNLNYKERRIIFGGAVTPALHAEQKHRQAAFFSQVDIDLTQRWTATLGIRYTQEHKALKESSFGNCTFDFSVCTVDQNLDKTWRNTGGKAGLQWRKSDDLMLYGSWTRAYRSGGYNTRNPNPQTPAGPYNEETVDAFELGSKWSPLNGRLRINSDVYYNRFDGLQRTILDSNNLQTIHNAAKATITGAEIDFTAAVTEHLTVHLSGAYTDAKYNKFEGLDVSFVGDGVPDPKQAKHLKLFNVSKWAASGSVTYDGIKLDTPWGYIGELSLHGSAMWRDKYPSNIRNFIIYNSVFIANVSATLSLPGNRFKITAYSRNITDERMGQGAAATSLFFVDFINPPRTWGLRFTYQL